jgi:DNA-binding GntR family transcriptional regulator
MGLLTTKVRRGAYVSEVNAKDASDVFYLMALLESGAAAARLSKDPELQEHTAIMAAIAKRGYAAAMLEMEIHIASGQEAAI